MSYKNPPKFHSETGASWTAFKKEASIWAKLTELKPEQQGLALFLTSLEGTVRDTVRDSISEDDVAKADGFKKIIDYVDGLFKKEKSRESYEAFKDFIYYKRSDNGSMDTYLMEFTRRYTKAKAQDMVVSDAILAFAVLEGVNLTEDQKGICLATCSELKYEKMKTQIQNVVAPKPVKKQNIHPEVQAEVQFYAEEYPSEYYEQNIDSSAYEESGNSAATFDSHDVAANTCTGNNDVQTDANEVYYTNNANRSRRPYYQPRGNFQGRQLQGNGFSQRFSAPREQQSNTLNPDDEFGRTSSCTFCRSIFHWIDKCPHAPLHVKNAHFRARGTRRPSGRGPVTF